MMIGCIGEGRSVCQFGVGWRWLHWSNGIKVG